MFIFAVLLVHVTKQIATRTLHIRAKSFGVPLLAAVSALVVWTSVISMRTVAKVPARLAHTLCEYSEYRMRVLHRPAADRRARRRRRSLPSPECAEYSGYPM